MGLHLYLAPHLDDAVLSCGGLIARQVQAGERVLVLTVFAGDPAPGIRSPFAERLAQAGRAVGEYAALRRSEDCAAVERLGAMWLHWEYPDSIYRPKPDGVEPLYPDVVSIFDQVAPGERMALAGALAVRLQALCDGQRPATICAPLTAGHHVDHQLVQWAARRLALRSAQLRFYEDYPYVENPDLLTRALAEMDGTWQPELEPMSPDALQAKIEAIACYGSQLVGLFGGAEALPERVKAYAHSLSANGPAERFWRPGSQAEASR